MNQGIPTAKIASTTRGKLSLAWSVPTLAIIIAIVLFCRWQLSKGPIVVIRFQDTSGLTAESPILYLGAIVGRIERISLHSDLTHVEVMARLDPSAANLASKGSTWRIIKPTVSLQGISGLETIIGPRYIQVQLGSGEPMYTFEGSPVGKSNEGKVFTLLVNSADGITIGAPIFYRGIEIGSITSKRLAKDSKKVRLRFIIEHEFELLIRENTLFWKIGGITVDAGWLGISFETSPLTALIKGGIAIATPNRVGELAEEGFTFSIEDDFDDDWLEWEPSIDLSQQMESE